jgi:maleate isomerase
MSKEHNIMTAANSGNAKSGQRIRIALLVPSSNTVMENDLHRALPLDTLFVSCTNFRALEAKPALEAALGISVITSNSAVIDAIEHRFASARRPFRSFGAG